MLNLFLANLVNFGLETNVVTNSGVGVLLLGREKKYASFRIVNTLFLLLGIAICSAATYFLNMFVYTKFDLVEIKVCVAVFLAAVYNLIICKLWKKISLFKYYLYESSCAYVFDLIFTVYVVMVLDLTLEIIPFLMSLAAAVVVVFFTNLIMGFFLEHINKSYLNINIRNVSARMFLTVIFVIFFHYVNMLI